MLVVKLVGNLILVYILVVAAAYFMQRSMQYYPDQSPVANPQLYHVSEFKVIEVKTQDGLTNIAWYAKPKKEDYPVIVLFHGNAGHIGDRSSKASLLTNAGYGVLLAEYRGYGGNGGSPTEEGLYEDGRAVMKWLQDNGVRASKVVLYGESLGSGIAMQLSREYGVSGVVLESPFTSLADAGKYHYPWLPVHMLIKDKYDNLKKIKKIDVPLLIIHGKNDQVIPFEQSEKLFKTAVTIKIFARKESGRHENLYDHGAFNDVDKFIKDYIIMEDDLW